MKINLALIMILIAASSVFAAPVRQEADEWELVAKLCGKLELVEHIADKKAQPCYGSQAVGLRKARQFTVLRKCVGRLGDYPQQVRSLRV